jgi:hypothetical protein
MQLRVARLCLDCEELHVEEACPICASQRYAFLSMWLPSEERRRWRRPAPPVAEAGPIGAVRRVVSRWFGIPESAGRPARPRTRAGDLMPRLDFEETTRAKSGSATALDPAAARNGDV